MTPKKNFLTIALTAALATVGAQGAYGQDARQDPDASYQNYIDTTVKGAAKCSAARLDIQAGKRTFTPDQRATCASFTAALDAYLLDSLKRGMETGHLDEDQVQDALKMERQVAADRRFFVDDK